MEVLEWFVKLKLYTKIYDVNYRFYEEHYPINHWSTNGLTYSINHVNFHMMFKITEDIDMTNKHSINAHKQIMSKINGLFKYEIPFKIYKDEYGDYRKIIIKTHHIVLVKNLYY